MILGQKLKLNAKHLAMVSLLGASLTSFNSYADVCSMVGLVDSENVWPISWESGDHLGDTQYSNQTHSCSSVPAGSTITNVRAHFHYVGKDGPMNKVFPHGDYHFITTVSTPSGNTINASGYFNVTSSKNLTIGLTADYDTANFNGLDPNGLTFYASARVDPDGTNYPCNDINNNSFCKQWLKVQYDWTVTYTPPPEVPQKISSVSAGVNGDDVTVSWSATSNTTSYEREVSINSGSWHNRRTYSASTRSATFADQNPGSYRYRVRSCNSDGCSDWTYSNTVTVSLGTPSSVSAGVSGRTVTLNWSAVSHATYYEREVSVNGGSWKNRYTLTGTSKTYHNYAAGSYKYRMRACNSTGCGNWSGASNTIAVVILPGNVSTPSASVSGRTVTLSWNAVANADYYQREVSVNGGAWKNNYTLYGTSKTYHNYAYGSYKYRMRACNAHGCSSWSSASNTITVQ